MKNGRKEELVQRTVSATFGSFLTCLLVTPFDVVKVRMQAPSGQVFNLNHIDLYRKDSVWRGILAIKKSEGIVSLYRGFVPTLIMSIPSNVVYFIGYEGLRDRLNAKYRSDLNPIVAGGFARILAVTVTSPIELVRTRMQHQGSNVFKVVGNLKNLMKSEGSGALLFRGLTPTLWRDVPFSAVYWMVLEKLRSRYKRKPHGNDLMMNVLAGAVSGGIAATLTVPFDVVKTRYQVKGVFGNYSLWSSLKSIWMEEGMRGLTAGLVPRIFKVAPACAIMFSSYEFCKLVLINKYKE